MGTLSDGADSGITLASLAAHLACDSVWTVDLAYLLAEHGVACEYLTASGGVDEAAYRENAFYAKSLDDDARRVTRLFAAASAEGVEARRCPRVAPKSRSAPPPAPNPARRRLPARSPTC